MEGETKDARCDDGDSDDVDARPATATTRMTTLTTTTTARRGGDVDGIVEVVAKEEVEIVGRDKDSLSEISLSAVLFPFLF